MGELGEVIIENEEQMKLYLSSIDSKYKDNDFSKITYPIRLPTASKFEYTIVKKAV